MVFSSLRMLFTKELVKSTLWIGLNDQQDERVFVWQNKTCEDTCPVIQTFNFELLSLAPVKRSLLYFNLNTGDGEHKFLGA